MWLSCSRNQSCSRPLSYRHGLTQADKVGLTASVALEVRDVSTPGPRGRCRALAATPRLAPRVLQPTKFRERTDHQETALRGDRTFTIGR